MEVWLRLLHLVHSGPPWVRGPSAPVDPILLGSPPRTCRCTWTQQSGSTGSPSWRRSPQRTLHGRILPPKAAAARAPIPAPASEVDWRARPAVPSLPGSNREAIKNGSQLPADLAGNHQRRAPRKLGCDWLGSTHAAAVHIRLGLPCCRHPASGQQYWGAKTSTRRI